MKVLNLFKINNGGKIKAFYSIDLGPLTIRDVKLVEGNAGELWAAMPSKEYNNKKGEKKWSGIIQVSNQALMDKISELGRKAYNGETAEEDDVDIPF